MKPKILFITSLLLIIGCSKEPINIETLGKIQDSSSVHSHKIYFTNDTNKPYSGQVFSLYGDGKKEEEGTLKDGKKVGIWNRFYENGQKRSEIRFKDGKAEGLRTGWYESGQKRSEIRFKDGKTEGGATLWYDNGKKMLEQTFKDGKLISEKKY